jgi:hypothetical protein
MSTTADVERRLRDANPTPADLPKSEAAWSSAELLERIDLQTGVSDPSGTPVYVHRPARRRRGPLIAIGAAFAVLVVIGAVALVSSTSTDAPPATTPTTQAPPTTIESPPTTEAAIAPAVPRTIEIEAFDYGYSGFDTDFKVGDVLELFNNSESEYHSLIVIRINDEYPVRTIEDVIALNPQDIWLNGVADNFGRRLHAAPGTTATGRIRLQTPGTYIALDWIPQNADPEDVSKTINPNTGFAKTPPFQVAGGLPGYQRGMIVEFIVTEANTLTTTTIAEVAPPPGTEALPPTIEITSVDYEYLGVPDVVPVGTTFGFANASEDEYHMMWMLRLDSNDERTAQELAALPVTDIIDSEGTERFGSVLAVLGAKPDEPYVDVVGGGNIVWEPGRYVILCLNAVGHDVAGAAAAFASGPLPQDEMDANTAHFAVGEFAEFIVEE